MRRTLGAFAVMVSVVLAPSACVNAAVTPAASTTPAASATAASDPSLVRIDARANIFGAGHASPPAPGSGGAGVLPPMWPLPAGAARTLVFESVTGTVTGIVTVLAPNGPGGDHNAPTQVTMSGGRGTDVESFGGISGIVDHGNTTFLVGVFLGDAEPTGAAPERLDFTDREQFDILEPRLAQTFFIGEGGARKFRVPVGATRLFLGFADAFFWQGPPGYYGNNSGFLEARPKILAQ
jgi:hypothetical protein